MPDEPVIDDQLKQLLAWKQDAQFWTDRKYDNFMRSLLMLEGYFYLQPGQGSGFRSFRYADDRLSSEYRYVSNMFARLVEDCTTDLLKTLPEMLFEIPGDDPGENRGEFLNKVWKHFAFYKWKLPWLLYEIYNYVPNIGLGFLKLGLDEKGYKTGRLVEQPLLDEWGIPQTDPSTSQPMMEKVPEIQSKYRVTLTAPDMFSIVPDPAARSWDQVRTLWYRPYLSYGDIMLRYKDLLKDAGITTYEELKAAVPEPEVPTQMSFYLDVISGYSTVANTTITGKMTTIDEFWVWPDDKNPNGQVITALGTKLLQKTNWPVTPIPDLPGQGCPFIPFYWRKQPLTIWGSGLDSRLKQPQRRANATWNKLWRMWDVFIYALTVPQNARFAGSNKAITTDLTGKEMGKIILTDEGKYPPSFIHPAIDKEILSCLNIIAAIRMEMKELAGQRKPFSARSGRDRGFQAAEDEQRLNTPAVNLDMGMELLARTGIEWITQCQTIPEILRIVGRDGEVAYRDFKRSMVQHEDVIVIASTPTPRDPMAQEQHIMGFAAELSKIQDPKIRRIVLEKLDKTREWGEVDSELTEIQRIVREHESWERGVIPDVDPIDMDELHILRHEDYCRKRMDSWPKETKLKVMGRTDSPLGPGHILKHVMQATKKSGKQTPQKTEPGQPPGPDGGQGGSPPPAQPGADPTLTTNETGMASSPGALGIGPGGPGGV